MKLTVHKKAVSITARRLHSEREPIHTGGALPCISPDRTHFAVVGHLCLVDFIVHPESYVQ